MGNFSVERVSVTEDEPLSYGQVIARYGITITYKLTHSTGFVTFFKVNVFDGRIDNAVFMFCSPCCLSTVKRAGLSHGTALNAPTAECEACHEALYLSWKDVYLDPQVDYRKARASMAASVACVELWYSIFMRNPLSAVVEAEAIYEELKVFAEGYEIPVALRTPAS